MMITLKHYQQRTLAKLTAFLEQARFAGAEYAFREHQEAQGYSKQYKTLAKLEDIPYICLRLPTGGGKTLTADGVTSSALAADRKLLRSATARNTVSANMSPDLNW